MPLEIDHSGPELHCTRELAGEESVGCRDFHSEVDVFPVQQVGMALARSEFAGPVWRSCRRTPEAGRYEEKDKLHHSDQVDS